VAFAPIARDQGVTSFPPGDVAAAFVEGVIVELAEQRRREPNAVRALKHVTYEAGPAFVDAVREGVARGLAAGREAAKAAVR
jgi:hypothetical protein